MINIRQADKSEVSALQELNNEIFVNNPHYDPDLKLDWALSRNGQEYFSNLLEDSEAYCFIAEDDNRKVGYIAAATKKIDYRNSKYIEIENLGVVPEYQSKGIGKLLMEECLNWAKTKGYQRAYVNSYFENKGAINFYKKNGFQEIDISLEKALK